MPTVNERCKILRSLNRVYVFEIVLLLVPRLKILRRRGLSYFGIFEKQRGTVEFPRNKPQHEGRYTRYEVLVWLTLRGKNFVACKIATTYGEDLT